MLINYARAKAEQGPPAPKTGQIIITFHGLQSRDGYLRVSLYKAAASFPDGAPAARKDICLTTLSPRSPLGAVKVSFGDLRPGRYAVCAFHDRDSSGKLKQNFLGIPTEEWGMSNNPRPNIRTPRFEEAQLNIPAPGATMITINLDR